MAALFSGELGREAFFLIAALVAGGALGRLLRQPGHRIAAAMAGFCGVFFLTTRFAFFTMPF